MTLLVRPYLSLLSECRKQYPHAPSFAFVNVDAGIAFGRYVHYLNIFVREHLLWTVFTIRLPIAYLVPHSV